MKLEPVDILAAAPSTARSLPTRIYADAKGDRIAYASGKSIFVRSIDNPSICIQYTGHLAKTTVARFSPSGFYIASGDESGKVRVWDCSRADGSTKLDFAAFAGAINDIAWDADSQKIIAVGKGREHKGRAFTFDTGNSVGDIAHHQFQAWSVAIRPKRPLRAVTGGELGDIALYANALKQKPFTEYKRLDKVHSKDLFCLEYSPDGEYFASAGSDGRIFTFNGNSNDVEDYKEIAGSGPNNSAHHMSILGLSWKSDSRQLVSIGTDQYVRIWDVGQRKLKQEWRLGEANTKTISRQQVGVVWARDDLIIVIDLSGALQYFNPDQEQGPIRTILGHQKGVTAAIYTNGTFFTSSFDHDVRVLAWDLTEKSATDVKGEPHGGKMVLEFAASGLESKAIYSIGFDNKLLRIRGNEYDSGIEIEGQGRAVAMNSDNQVFVATQSFTNVQSSIRLYHDLQPAKSLNRNDVTILAASRKWLAAGFDNGNLEVFQVGTDLEPVRQLKPMNSEISALSFSPDGTYLVAGNLRGHMHVYSVQAGKKNDAGKVMTEDWDLYSSQWGLRHTGRVTTVAWVPTSTFVVSSGLETSLVVHSVRSVMQHTKFPNAHKEGVKSVAWTEKNTILSTGADGTVRTWKVKN